MAQTPRLIHTLKKQLKAHGYTYADVASTLNISQASVKRLFAEQGFSLQRLELICQMMGIQFSELVALMEQDQPQLQQLTEQQEADIVNNPLLLMILLNIINGHSFDDLCQEITISPTDCIQKLAQLDRLKIIDLLPNNRIKLLIAPNFCWRINGPIQQFFQTHVKEDFFNSSFKKDSEKLVVLNGKLSEHSVKEMQKKSEQLVTEFNALMQQDSQLTNDQRQHTTMVIAARPWRFALFDQFRRKPFHKH